jgi:UDP-3-O-[3-hydroxymyristoyl] glucosamine N-acyltransferase
MSIDHTKHVDGSDDPWATGSHPGFFERSGPMPLGALAARLGAEVSAGADAEKLIHDIRALDMAGPEHLAFLDNRKYLPQLATTQAGACLITPALAERAPAGAVPVLTAHPYHAFARGLMVFYPGATRPQVLEGSTAFIDPTARIETGAIIQPGALIGPEARIGRGTVIAAGAVIGRRVTIGRDGFVGPGAAITHALVGDRVILHAGVRIGQDGFGFAMGPKGHLKVPQIGRVIIQDDVEIGANTTIDRGALKDTVIGEGTKIDNLVQIGHNAVIGRHCVIVAQVGISGSTELEDFVVFGGQAGVVGHVRIGHGAQVGAASSVLNDLPAGGRYAGFPAVRLTEWARQTVTLRKLARRRGHGDSEPGDSGGDENTDR